MAHAHINSDPETRALLNEYSEDAGMPRTQFLRVLTKRYGPLLLQDLTEPASVRLWRYGRPEPGTPDGDPQCPACGYPVVNGEAYKGIYEPGKPCGHCGAAEVLT